MEIYDAASKTWKDYASNTSDYPYIANYISSTAAFDILFSTDLGATYGGQVASMRIKSTSTLSSNPSVFDTFSVSFNYECAADSITLTANIATQNYKFSDPDQNLPTPSFTHIAGCAISFQLMAYSEVTQSWRNRADADNPLPFIKSFDSTDGQAVV